ncbi:hypothetical protein COV18_06935 [Candidatus Woesearchaeota archaeon CG10_big_fil_rev_8_21_14_0_10_37_12]|nr:MAG: hypothetical protein COV18_06935 [Candidatus Woesearchaeota archaeon CG10_big_fil_rev_8_21_14_0_10_37_12]
MVSITLSVPEEVKKKMDRFREINWSGFVRGCIVEKTAALSKREELLKKFREEKPISDWAVELQRKGRANRLAYLKKKGLI